jgi:hypothetical protein
VSGEAGGVVRGCSLGVGIGEEGSGGLASMRCGDMSPPFLFCVHGAGDAPSVCLWILRWEAGECKDKIWILLGQPSNRQAAARAKEVNHEGREGHEEEDGIRRQDAGRIEDGRGGTGRPTRGFILKALSGTRSGSESVSNLHPAARSRKSSNARKPRSQEAKAEPRMGTNGHE